MDCLHLLHFALIICAWTNQLLQMLNQNNTLHMAPSCLAQIDCRLGGIYYTSWKVFLGTVKHVLIKRDTLVQKTTPIIVKSAKAILDDVSL